MYPSLEFSLLVMVGLICTYVLKHHVLDENSGDMPKARQVRGAPVAESAAECSTKTSDCETSWLGGPYISRLLTKLHHSYQALCLLSPRVWAGFDVSTLG